MIGQFLRPNIVVQPTVLLFIGLDEVAPCVQPLNIRLEN